MAQGAFRAAAARQGIECHVDSAGTASYHIGSPPDPRAIAAASAQGVDIADQTARQLEREDFFRFSHIFAMDEANLVGIQARAPRDGTAKIAMLNDALENNVRKSIADPYYGDEELFAKVWDEIAAAAEDLAARIAGGGIVARP